MRAPNTLPVYLFIIVSNALPIYGAFTGKLIFFQILYLFWFESLLLILFDCIRIGAARGTISDGALFAQIPPAGAVLAPVGTAEKVGLILRTLIVRILILAFYLIFIIIFVMLMVTDRQHLIDAVLTVAFRNSFFNTAIGLFIISNTVQLIAQFFINGQYRTASPRNYATVFDGRTILLHVMTAGVVFLHKFFFEGTNYMAMGEIAYVGIFMLIKTVLDINHAKKQQLQADTGMPMI